MKKVLFVLCGFPIGGIETYILRLTKELSGRGISVDIFLLSGKYDFALMNEIRNYANILICERTFLSSRSSWLNAFLPHKAIKGTQYYDVVHVIDILTLGFVLLNSDVIKFKGLSIGIYHSMEICWWRDKNVYFRQKLLEIYDKNVGLTLFPNESVASMASNYTGENVESFNIVPLGIDLLKYKQSAPSIRSKKIISVGRLVDFKVYNRHMISQLAEVRKIADLEYYIYGDGAEKESLYLHAVACGVEKFVHFKGSVPYENLQDIFNDAFCFIGSGTTIIEASAAGIPSIVGIESILEPLTCGFFCDIKGYSYNELSATTTRVSFVEAISKLVKFTAADYETFSAAHRLKASCFDIKITTTAFLEKSTGTPDFNIRLNRWRALLSFSFSLLRFGPKALKSRMHQ